MTDRQRVDRALDFLRPLVVALSRPLRSDEQARLRHEAHDLIATLSAPRYTVTELDRINGDGGASEWAGILEDHREIYIRYRFGELTVWINENGEVAGECPLRLLVGPTSSSRMDEEELRRLIGFDFSLPEKIG